MKHLIITVKETRSELQIRDFLAESTHSPEWIGDADNWEIKTIQTVFDGKHVRVTALLNNDKWSEPCVEAVTGNEVKNILKENVAIPVCFEYLTGCGGRMSMNEHQSHITPISTEIDDEYIVLWWEGTDSRKTDSKELLKYLGFEASKDEFLDAINDVYNLREDPSKKLAVTFTNAPDSEIHPVTEVRIVDGKLNLIYTHDVNLRK